MSDRPTWVQLAMIAMAVIILLRWSYLEWMEYKRIQRGPTRLTINATDPDTQQPAWGLVFVADPDLATIYVNWLPSVKIDGKVYLTNPGENLEHHT